MRECQAVPDAISETHAAVQGSETAREDTSEGLFVSPRSTPDETVGSAIGKLKVRTPRSANSKKRTNSDASSVQQHDASKKPKTT